MLRDENLVDLETDKVVLEVPAPAAGVLKEIKFDDGTTVTSGQLLAVIEEGATALPGAGAPAVMAASGGTATPAGNAVAAAKSRQAEPRGEARGRGKSRSIRRPSADPAATGRSRSPTW